jgi:hypothetical protein
MQKLLFLLFFACLSANVWAQQPPTSLEIAQMVLDFYTEPSFLDTLKTTGITEKDTAFFLIANGDDAFEKGNKLLFTFDKKNRKLTHTYIALDSIKKTWASGYNIGYEVYTLQISTDRRISIDPLALIAYENRKRFIEVSWGCCGGTHTCQLLLEDGSYKTVTMMAPCYTQLKVVYSEKEKKYILDNITDCKCEDSKGYRRMFFARRYLK